MVNSTVNGSALIEGLFSDNNFTIYTPTNQAFSDIGINSGAIPNNTELEDVLRYHVSHICAFNQAMR